MQRVNKRAAHKSYSSEGWPDEDATEIRPRNYHHFSIALFICAGYPWLARMPREARGGIRAQSPQGIHFGRYPLGHTSYRAYVLICITPFPRALRRSPGYLHAVVQLDAV